MVVILRWISIPLPGRCFRAVDALRHRSPGHRTARPQPGCGPRPPPSATHSTTAIGSPKTPFLQGICIHHKITAATGYSPSPPKLRQSRSFYSPACSGLPGSVPRSDGGDDRVDVPDRYPPTTDPLPRSSWRGNVQLPQGLAQPLGVQANAAGEVGGGHDAGLVLADDLGQ